MGRVIACEETGCLLAWVCVISLRHPAETRTVLGQGPGAKGGRMDGSRLGLALWDQNSLELPCEGETASTV